MNYKEELSRLLEHHTRAGLADLLGVTERTLQFWIAKEPKVPHPKMQQKIHELFERVLLPSVHSAPEAPASYTRRRWQQKINTATVPTAPLVPVRAQAGYVKAIDQAIFIDTLEQYALPPGVNPHGAIWRYWEIEGDSMEPAFHSGDIILTSQVHQMDWENLRNFYLYVIVTDEKVLFKRIFCKNALEWVLISENEEQYPQQLLPVEYIREVWVFRRSIISKAPPTREFKINV